MIVGATDEDIGELFLSVSSVFDILLELCEVARWKGLAANTTGVSFFTSVNLDSADGVA